jgi:serpin B
LSELEAALTAERFEGWARGMKKTDIVVVLPRFELHSATQLKKPLEQAGIKLAFDQGKADFRGMSAGGGLYLQDAYHDVFARVDETGTEAAAATAAVAHAAGLNLNQTRFIVDHPFLFVIRHRASGALVFLGRVVAPGTGNVP